MKKEFIFLCIALMSCAIFSPRSTPTATRTPTIAITATFTSSNTPKIIPTETPTIYLKGIVGKPASSYKGWKIMPDAITGEEIGGSYFFTIRADSNDIHSFYKNNIPSEWKLIVDFPEMLTFRGNKETTVIIFGKIKENPEYSYVIIQITSS
jgi:hypothetical protein